MAAPFYLAIHGRLVVVGKEPDGDSVRFVADQPEHYAQLKNGYHLSRRGRRRLSGKPGRLADRVSTSPSRDENDRLIVCGGIELHLSDLLVQANNDVRFQADLLDIVFVEK